jgi:hypothetical protein
MLLKTKLDDNVESPMKTHTEPSRKEKSQGKFSSPRNQKLVKVSPLLSLPSSSLLPWEGGKKKKKKKPPNFA